jgi:hypothetical protein
MRPQHPLQLICTCLTATANTGTTAFRRRRRHPVTGITRTLAMDCTRATVATLLTMKRIVAQTAGRRLGEARCHPRQRTVRTCTS